MNLTGSFTRTGLALSAKLNAGTPLRISRVVAASGLTPAPLEAASLSQPRQELIPNTPFPQGSSTILSAALLPEQASGPYTLRELGIYAIDPELGEILWKIYRLEPPMEIRPTDTMVLRFSFQETISQNVQVTVENANRGLLTEDDLQTVLAYVQTSHIPERTLHIPGSQLAKTIQELPRQLLYRYHIIVTGTVEEPVVLDHFYGSGSLSIEGPCTLKQTLHAYSCSLPLLLENLSFQPTEASSKETVGAYFQDCSFASVERCSFSGKSARSSVGLSAANGSRVLCFRNQMTDLSTVIRSNSASVISVVSDSSTLFARNKIGCHVWHGGVILLCENTGTLLGGSSNHKAGGVIAAANGTLL